MYHADLVGLLVGRLARVPVILWNGRSTLLNHRGIARLICRALVPLSRLPNAVVANSQARVRVHQALGYEPKQSVWVLNSLELTQFNPQPEALDRLRRS